jgi:hypothetical protein
MGTGIKKVYRNNWRVMISGEKKVGEGEWLWLVKRRGHLKKKSFILR